jgi:hypothetical protein
VATASLSKVLSHLRGILGRREADEQTDGDLLERFLTVVATPEELPPAPRSIERLAVHEEMG